MRKILIPSVIIIGAITLFFSCKKGANDPFLSLRSRDSRIVGTWVMTYLNIDSAITFSSSLKKEEKHYTTSYPVEDSIKRFSDGIGNNKDSVYKEILVINEDGSYIDSIFSKKKGSTVTRSRVVRNIWYWINAKKNKDGVVLQGYGTYKIDKLAWKELVLISEKETINYTNKAASSGTDISISRQLTFKRN